MLFFRNDGVHGYKTKMMLSHITVRVIQNRTFRFVIAKQCKIDGFP